MLAQPALNLSDSELVDLFSGLAIIARTKGILALDEIVPTCRDWVLRVFLNDVLNGLVPPLVPKLGETHIEALKKFMNTTKPPVSAQSRPFENDGRYDVKFPELRN